MSGVSVLRGSLIFRDALRSQERCWLTVLHISYGLMTELWPLVYGTGAGFSRTKHGSLRSQLSFFSLVLRDNTTYLLFYHWNITTGTLRSAKNKTTENNALIEYIFETLYLYLITRDQSWSEPTPPHTRTADMPLQRRLTGIYASLGESWESWKGVFVFVSWKPMYCISTSSGETTS